MYSWKRNFWFFSYLDIIKIENVLSFVKFIYTDQNNQIYIHDNVRFFSPCGDGAIHLQKWTQQLLSGLLSKVHFLSRVNLHLYATFAMKMMNIQISLIVSFQKAPVPLKIWQLILQILKNQWRHLLSFFLAALSDHLVSETRKVPMLILPPGIKPQKRQSDSCCPC